MPVAEGKAIDAKDDALQAYLDASSISKVNVHTISDRIELLLCVPYWPDAYLYERIQGYYSAQFPTSIYFDWLPICSNHASFEELIYSPFFIKLLRSREPALVPWLQGAKWILDDKNLSLILANAMSCQQMERLTGANRLADLIYLMTGVRPDIKLLNGDPAQTIDAQPLNLIREKSEEAKGTTSSNRCLSSQHKVGKKKSVRNEDIIYGKKINSVPCDISSITEEENKVCCQGTIFDLDSRELKSGRTLVSFSLTDQSDSVDCKFFCEKDELEEIKSFLKKAPAIKVQGSVQTDRYTQELIFILQSINRTTLACRLDQAPKKRVELHLHTQMSNMDGVSGLAELIKLASDLGHTHMALTDHGVVQGFPEAYQLGKKYGVTIIYGMEAYIFDDTIPDNQRPKTYHCILLAKNMTGLKNLYKLTTESHLRYFKRHPRIPKRLVEYAREGLIVGSACEAGELMQHLIHHPDDDTGLKDLASFYDYIEIQPLANNEFLIRKGLAEDTEALVQLNKRLWQLGQDLNKPVVATCDVHFANKDDAIFRSILMESKGFTDAEQQAPLYYRTTDEMLEEFAYLGEDEAWKVVVENPNLVAQEVASLKPVPDELFAPEIQGAEEKIEALTMDKAHALYGIDLPEIIEKRIKKELKAIIGNGFAVLYLIAHELVRKSNADGYIVGSRGSVGSSLVAYFAGITEVNALAPHYRCPRCCYSHFDESGVYGTGIDMPDAVCPNCGTTLEKCGFNIPFEIFLGFKGDKVPDIDLNFSGDYQGRAHAFTEELFGKDNVFRAGTIATVAEKTAYGYVKKFFDSRGVNQRNAEINRLRNGCTGVKRTTGQHPGGLMVIPKGIDVHEFTPLQRPADDVKSETVTTHFDYHSINERLVKLDLLGHDDPTVIKMLEDMTGVDVKTIPLDDPATMSLFSSTDAIGLSPERLKSTVATYGIPEFNTKFTRQMLEDSKPDNFAGLLRISGFSHGTDVWLNNAQDLIKNGTATVTEAISTRDDIMIFLIECGLDASDAFAIMEKVRKGKGVSSEYEAIMNAHHVPKWFIDSCKKIKYLFPKAHAVAYVMMAYRIAWFKINHPLAFYASYFTVRGIDDFDLEIVLSGETGIATEIDKLYNSGGKMTAKDKARVSMLEVALELYARGYHILPVDIEKSSARIFQIEGDALLPPFVAISGLGQSIANMVVEARDEKPFISIEDLQFRGRVGDAMIQDMRQLGVVNGLPESNQIGLFGF